MLPPGSEEKIPGSRSDAGGDGLREALPGLALVSLAAGCFLSSQVLTAVTWGPLPMWAALLVGSIAGVWLPLFATARALGLRAHLSVGLRRLGGRRGLLVLWVVAAALPLVHALGAVSGRVFPPGAADFELYEALLPDGLGSGVMGGVAVVVVAPLAEEILFRGLAQDALRAWIGTPGAVAVQAALFGISHGAAWLVAPITLLGLLLGGLVARTGNLSAAWLGHAIFNAVSYVELCATHDVRGTWLAGHAQEPLVLGAATLLFAVAVVALRREESTSATGSGSSRC
jgi:membrane protease YdiL (CAAX protease family)